MAANMQHIARAGRMMPQRLMREFNSIQVHQIVHRSVVQDTHVFTGLCWQANVPISDRMSMTMNLISNIAVAMNGVNAIVAANFSSRLERQIFHTSPTKEKYNQAIANKIMEFYKKPQLNRDDINLDSQLRFINTETYDPDEVVPRDSSLVTPPRPRLGPSPSPPPPDILPAAVSLSLASPDDRDNSNRHKVQNRWGDAILVALLDDGRDPEIAHVAARQVLPCDEDSPDDESSLDGPTDEVVTTVPSLQHLAADALQAFATGPADKYKSRLQSTRPTRNSGLNGNYRKSSVRTLQVSDSKNITQRQHAMLPTSSTITVNLPELMEVSKKNISQHKMYTISDDYTDSGRVRKRRLCSLSSQSAVKRRARP